jgi:hypothetical protein
MKLLSNEPLFCADFVREHPFFDPSRPIPKVKKEFVKTEQEIYNKYSKRKRDFFAPSQRSVKQARSRLLNAMSFPGTIEEMRSYKKKKLEEFLKKKTYKTKKAALEFLDSWERDWWGQYKGQYERAHTELFDSVIALRYDVPEGKAEDSGQFVAKVRYNKDEEIFLKREWVVKNFEKEVIHSVIHSYQQNFLDVEALNVKVEIDNVQIKSLRWFIPPVQGPMFRAGAKASFQAILSNHQRVALEEDYVKKNFPENFIVQVKNQGANNCNKFLKVPPGAPRTDEGHHLLNKHNPVVKYRQEGAATCLF